MSAVRENLVAARALINTQEKWEMRGKSYVTVFRDLDDDAYLAAKRALADAADLSHPAKLLFHLFHLQHADIMTLFDRAIEAQP